MMRSEFHIVSSTGRTVNIKRFGGDDTIVRDMEICTGVTVAMDRFKQPILLRNINGFETTHKSILSANCMRAAGLRVDDCPRKFDGNQCMWLPDRTYLVLLYKHDLSYLPIRKLTEEELRTLAVYDI